MRVPLFDDLFIFACNARFRFRPPILQKGVVRVTGRRSGCIPDTRLPTPEGRAITEARFQGAGAGFQNGF
jgi:hypothetical protein